MKKLFAVLALATIVSFILSGCGQDLNVTVYNATGITYPYTGWVAIEAHTEGNSQWLDAVSSCNDETGVDQYNSMTFRVKENSTLEIGGNGEQWETDSNGDLVKTPITLPTGSATLYGGFPDAPEWFASVNLDSVVIYKK